MGTQLAFVKKLNGFTMKINREFQYHLLSIRSKSIYLSEGCLKLKNQQKCSWLFELIVTWQLHPNIKYLDHQVWKLTKLNDFRYGIACYNNLDQVQLEKQVNSEDFNLTGIEILLKDRVAFLPVEI